MARVVFCDKLFTVLATRPASLGASEVGGAPPGATVGTATVSTTNGTGDPPGPEN